ncbi:MAG: family transporter, partial [Rhizobacter sp.]|nr:family transporter [Rhizobacter sp.]
MRQTAHGSVDRASEQRVHLHMPVDVRSASLVVIAVLASLFALHWAAAVFIPVLMGILFSYALSPVVSM